jgi:16S rRNA (guanine966-N2)-methyltransferase
MQILFGIHKGRRLKTPPDDRIRPTTGRMRDWLGNVLREHMIEARVLDLYAGSGGLGLLALSMGASHATFVDQAPGALKLVDANLRLLNESQRAAVVKQDVLVFLKRRQGAAWDLIFVDPPYDTTDYTVLMSALSGADILSRKGILMVEHPSHLKPGAEGLTLLRNKAFGRSTISLFQPAEPTDDGSAGLDRPH